MFPRFLSEGTFIGTLETIGNFGSRVQWSQHDRKQLNNKLRRVIRFTRFLLLKDPEPDGWPKTIATTFFRVQCGVARLLARLPWARKVPVSGPGILGRLLIRFIDEDVG